MKRKTDDKIILEMLKSGKKQKEIAEHFNVSPAAICKRIKRLTPPETPTFNGLTEKEKNFALEKAKGKTSTQAVIDSYEVTSLASAKSLGHQLMAKDEMQMAISELMNYHNLTKGFRLQKLKTHVDNRDPNVSLKALDQSWKLDGSYAPEKHVTVNFSRADAERELEALEVSTMEKRKKRKEQVEIWKQEGVSESEIIQRLLDDN